MATTQKKKISEVELTELSSNVLKLSAENVLIPRAAVSDVCVEN